MTTKKPEPHDLILDHLRAIRGDVGEMKDNIRDLQGSVHALRTEVHALRGDVLRQERSMAALELDVDRIKVRLSLNDTQQ